MAEKVEAIIKPELLIWARKSSGLDLPVAAKKIGTTVDRLLSWESGQRRPTISQLRKIGAVYKRPMAVFYLPSPPKDFSPMHDFRRLPVGEERAYSSELLYEIRRAHSRREIAIELYEELEEEGIPKSPVLRISRNDEPETVALKIRSFLEISIDNQKTWANDYESFNKWRAAIEAKNVLVFQAIGISVDEMRGFSISKRPFPTIVLNVKDAVVARTFTLLHELTHILLGKEGLCDLGEGEEIEIFCNQVAGATLVPKALLLAEPELRTKTASWSDDGIKALASRYKVSKEVILRRLLTLGRITSDFYKRKRMRYEAPFQLAKKAESVAIPQFRKVISSAGPLFSKLVLSSYHQEKITASDVSDFLSVHLKHLPKIESAIFG